jgi:hypothetical protein
MKVRDAAFFVVSHRAAQFLLGHFFVCDGLDDVRAGERTCTTFRAS